MEGLPDTAAPGEGRRGAQHVHRREPTLSTGNRRVVLWRHGQTIWNVASRFQGHTDIPLDDTGVAQAKRAARMLAALSPEALLSSDLCRANDTAQPLSELASLPVTLDAGLRERKMGCWEGLSRDEVEERFPAEWAARQPSDGETFEQLAERVVAVVERALEKVSPEGTLVLVTHGASARAAIAGFLQLPVPLWLGIGPIGNCAWSILGEGRAGWRLLEHNAGTLPEPVLSDDR